MEGMIVAVLVCALFVFALWMGGQHHRKLMEDNEFLLKHSPQELADIHELLKNMLDMKMRVSGAAIFEHDYTGKDILKVEEWVKRLSIHDTYFWKNTINEWLIKEANKMVYGSQD